MGNVALSLLSRFGNKESARVVANVYGFINIWKEPFQALLHKHMEAYENGMREGDIESAFYNIIFYFATARCCGENICSLEQKLCTFVKRAIHCKQTGTLKFLIPFRQLISDLSGSTVQAYAECFKTESSYFADIQQNGEVTCCRLYSFLQKYKAFLFGNMDDALHFYELQLRFPIEECPRATSVPHSIFIDGMIAFYFARKQGCDKSKWTGIGEGIVETMRPWVKSSSWNFLNKLLLLEAECCFCKDHEGKAIELYRASAMAAKKSKFIHEEGLAYEKAATFLLNRGQKGDALDHFIKSKKCYEKWGAQALVDRIEKVISLLMPMCP